MSAVRPVLNFICNFCKSWKLSTTFLLNCYYITFLIYNIAVSFFLQNVYVNVINQDIIFSFYGAQDKKLFVTPLPTGPPGYRVGR
jgi:hypothetical protein